MLFGGKKHTDEVFQRTDFSESVAEKNRGRFMVIALATLLILFFLIGIIVLRREKQRAKIRRNRAYREIETLLQYNMNHEAEMRTRRLVPQTEEELFITMRAQFAKGRYDQLLSTLQAYQEKAPCWDVQKKMVSLLFQEGHVGHAYQLLLLQSKKKSNLNDPEWKNLQQQLLACCEVTPMEETIRSTWRGKGLIVWQNEKEWGIYSASGEKIRPDLTFDAVIITEEGFSGRRGEDWMDFDAGGSFRRFSEKDPQEAAETDCLHREPHWQEENKKWELFGTTGKIHEEKWEEVTEFSEKGIGYGKKGSKWYCIRIPALNPEGRIESTRPTKDECRVQQDFAA